VSKVISSTTLHWFRQDLRVRDNPALSFASEHGAVLAVYIQDLSAPAEFMPGGASCWWLHHSLNSLKQSLDGKLHCLSGNPLDILLQLVAQRGIKRVVWNRCYEPWQILRDKQIKQALKDAGVEVHSFNGHLLWEPWQVLKKDATPYKVFTPYYRKGCLQKAPPRMPVAKPENLQLEFASELDEGIDALNLLPDINWHRQIAQQWLPGEQGAAQNLSEFLPDSLSDYKEQRNIPDVRGTSRLAPHLHFGEISANQVWYAAIDAMQGDIHQVGLDCFLSELGWREFSHYLLYHFPELPVKNFNSKFDHFVWQNDEDSLKAWQTGQTGFPIIDAGMRELWQTGYMHNRVRMVVGSFLVKNLLLDWRLGERWFWDCLLDADLAANSASWQWVAGSGADAAPYFRIFNPLLQGQKFDPQGHYVRQYCPEIAKLPDKFIHNPWEAPPAILQQAGLTLGQHYPKPIVDLKASRGRALAAFSHCKELDQQLSQQDQDN
jgi:deoxyribodipyrimidine photo-lyase